MAKAMFNGRVVAESDETVQMEGSHYFPAGSINAAFFVDSDHTSVCPHKGTASYKHVEVDGQRAENGAWIYPNTTTDYAKPIEGYYAFWNGVTVEG